MFVLPRLTTLLRYVATCMLDDVGSNLKRSNISCNILDVALVWPRSHNIVGLEHARYVHLLSARGLGYVAWKMLQAFGQAFTLKQGHEIIVMQLFLTKT